MNQAQSPPVSDNFSLPNNAQFKINFGSQILSSSEQRQLRTRLQSQKTLRVIPIGGLGEVGKNLNVIEYGNDAIIVDAGFMLGVDFPGINYAIPELTYLEKIKPKIRGYIFTHGHLDHVGAMPYILPLAPAPCYGSRFSLEMLERQVKDREPNLNVDKRVMNPDTHEKVTIGPFTIELVRVTHSIPDACAVSINTPVGRIVHTGDFKLDPTPLDNKPSDLERFTQLGRDGVLLLMSDSTNCEDEGRTPTERVIEPALLDILKQVRGRVILSAVSTNINRLQMLIDVMVKTGRKVAIDGRSMLANIELSVKHGFIKIPQGTIVAMRDSARLRDSELGIISTGHQGELNSVLLRMASGEHKFIKLKLSDSVIMSSSIIPGNEKAVVAVVDRLMREGAKVYRHQTTALDNTGPLHVSGHARREELADMIQMLKPRFFMPIHGEFHHQIWHADLALKEGIARERIFVFEKGDVLELGGDLALRTERVAAGALLIDQTGSVVPSVVIKDRTLMSEDGIVVTVLTIDRKSGQLLTSPDIITRGFIYIRDNEELLNNFRSELRHFSLRRYAKVEINRFKQELRDFVSNYLYKTTQRSPIIIPVVNVVGGGNSGGTGAQRPPTNRSHSNSTRRPRPANLSNRPHQSHPASPPGQQNQPSNNPGNTLPPTKPY